MSWGYNYNKPSRDFTRDKATQFDAAWHGLSVDARSVVVNTLTMGYDSRDEYSGQFVDKVGQAVADELVAAKLARFASVKAKGGERQRVILVEDARSFVGRIKDLHRFKVLSDREDTGPVVQYAFGMFGNGVDKKIQGILSGAGYRVTSIQEDIQGYVISTEWQGIALKELKNPLAERVVALVREAGKPVLLKEVAGTLANANAKDVDAAVCLLVESLVLFEDLDPKTYDLLLGIAPAVKLIEAAQAKLVGPGRGAGPLRTVPASEVDVEGPSTGLVVNDMRSFLMEVLTAPPAVRQDGQIYQKDLTRIQATLVPWPDWVNDQLDLRPGDRLMDAVDYSEKLRLVEVTRAAKPTVQITEAGREWLAMPPNRQYEEVYRRLREIEESSVYGSGYDDFERSIFGHSSMMYRSGPPTDMAFVGAPLGIEFRTRNPKRKPTQHRAYFRNDFDPTNKDYVRKLLEDVMRELPASGYIRVRELADQAISKDPLPLLGGRDIKDVNIWFGGRVMPQLMDKARACWTLVILTHIMEKLVPLDAADIALDKEGDVLVRATPRLMAFYGKAKLPSEPVAAAASSVIVQPDFTVTVIGLSTSAAATLAGFCDRVQGHTGTGALTFKLTRDSIRRAVTQSKLTGAEIVKSLEGLVSKALPANVATEIHAWADWVRKVNVDNVLLVRCPDIETTARVVTALGKTAERISDHYVAVKLAKISSTERQRLLAQGVVITTERIALPTDPKPEPKPKAAPKKPGRPKKKK